MDRKSRSTIYSGLDKCKTQVVVAAPAAAVDFFASEMFETKGDYGVNG